MIGKMGRRRTKKQTKSQPRGVPREPLTGVRVIGGRLRGSELKFVGQSNTRPMKDRTREAIFNLLGPDVAQRIVFDLFAGTGALAIEAISRGAESALLLERHFPTTRLLRDCAEQLGIASQIEVVAGDTFHWANRVFDPGRYPPNPPWLVFCCPPYDLYVEREQEMLGLIEIMSSSAPQRSLIVVESDERFDTARLPANVAWDKRNYPPAVVSIGEVS